MPRLASGLSLAALQSALLLLLLGGHLSSHTAIAVDGAGPGSPTAVSLRQTDKHPNAFLDSGKNASKPPWVQPPAPPGVGRVQRYLLSRRARRLYPSREFPSPIDRAIGSRGSFAVPQKDID